MPQRIEQGIDDGFLREGFGLEAVFGHSALELVGAGVGPEDAFEGVVVYLVAEVRDGVINRLDEAVGFVVGDGRLEGVGDELGGNR
ncbi:hypothetical protein [Haloferax mucosum]|uniref:hypothetical protein n=1 Tax=Haloferax mucosum TaxID=403181 RepID=UPI001F4CE64C|nr:hypothetical protein [Haloferax mucosum]